MSCSGPGSLFFALYKPTVGIIIMEVFYQNKIRKTLSPGFYSRHHRADHLLTDWKDKGPYLNKF